MTTEPIGGTPPPLAGLAVAVTAARRHRELANSLTQHGAMVSEFPLLRLVSVGAEPALRWATQRCLEAPPHIVVVTTAGGWRRWLAAAATWNVSPQLIEALHHATIAARGEAAAAAVREFGLPVAWMAPAETVDELVSWLGKLDLTGRRVVVQEHGGALAALQTALTEQGADVTRVVTERWAPLANRAPARRLATMVARRELHAVVFTNAAAVSTLLDTASKSGGLAGLLKAFATDVAAVCVNPTVAAPLTGYGLPVICSPEPSPGAVGGVLRDRVRGHSTSHITAGGHHFLLQGHAVIVDGSMVVLSPELAALLRALADLPAEPIRRTELARAAWPHAPVASRHTVDRRVCALQAALGPHSWLIEPVPGHGYQLSMARG